MIALIQRVSEAAVSVEDQVIGEIKSGLLVLLGVEKGDDEEKARRLVEKVTSYRVFGDDEGKMNLNVKQIEGEVLVAHDIKDTEKLDGQILVTSRTDPGWVPLYPSSSGLLIERGSLLSHSAVVARELGLPTIVGVDGGLMDRLKTGMKVRVDAGKGEIRILENDD